MLLQNMLNFRVLGFFFGCNFLLNLGESMLFGFRLGIFLLLNAINMWG